ncbi:MAG TPA: SDR family NAD(P)-dependent oxidoreductase [Pyrinomonadaceae bacterium]|jgi:NAD(P)-dependent dehydrogenase (short-subunit alcohol dehydrogenase family)
MKSLEGSIALVAGATRGAGRGIACMLGEAGATVYCTGRSSLENRPPKAARQTATLPRRKRSRASAFELSKRPETIEETAEMVTARGGKGIPVRVDHTVEEQVSALLKRIGKEQGRLDILVNDVWGGDELTEWGKPFWQLPLDKGLLMLERAVHSHIITSHYAAPLMIKHKRGLIIEITDGDGYYYRGNFFYDLVKTSVIRLAFDMAVELRKHKITALALTPGFLRSEAMLDFLGVTEADWQKGAKKYPSFSESETPFFVGRAVAALASDPRVRQKSGRVYSSWGLAAEYGFEDVDGRQPNIEKYVLKKNRKGWYKKCDETFYEYWMMPSFGKS